MRIGVISDSHSYIDDRICSHLEGCDEIWHAGDVGSREVLDRLQKLARLRAVYGNIDGSIIRSELREHLVFQVEEKKVLMTHIAGYPGKYNHSCLSLISLHKPDIVVAGHSHILKIIYDRALQHLHINPGASGIYGLHKVRTLVRFSLDDDKISNMQVVEMERNSAKAVD